MQTIEQCNRILHIHPTRRCNLRCLHCYSSSSPDEQDRLSVELLLQAIADASQQGYTFASFSGGEPILYKPLIKLLKQAQSHGLRTGVVTNGMLLSQRRLEELAEAIDVLVISLDGMPESHNKMRGNPQAFEKMNNCLEDIRKSGLKFGFLFTLTRKNFRELPWVVNFALEQGASLLQIHPLEADGRAKESVGDSFLNQGISAYVYLQVIKFQAAVADKLHIHLDLTHQEVFRTYPDLFFANSSIERLENKLFAEILSPLIIEADGTVVPMQYGFPRQYALGNLHQASLGQLINQWLRQSYPSFLKLCEQVYQEITAPSELPIMDWYQVLSKQAAKI